MNFNRANVNTFFENSSKVLDENKFKLHSVYYAGWNLVTVCVAVNAREMCATHVYVPNKKTFFFDVDQ
jgi:hypothetical protein